MMPCPELSLTPPLRSAAVRRSVFLALIALVAGGCGGSAPTISKDALAGIVLAPGDLPQLRRFDVGPQARLDNLAGPRKDPTRFGREGGWKARYRRPGTPRTPGPLVVESRADVFSSSDGAKRDLHAYDEEFTQMIATAPGLRRRLPSPGHLGEAAIAMTLRQPGSLPVRFYRIAWREHNATASVVVEGFEGRISLAEAVALARRQEAHLRAAIA
jgi:hypothetical protein